MTTNGHILVNVCPLALTLYIGKEGVECFEFFGCSRFENGDLISCFGESEG